MSYFRWFINHKDIKYNNISNLLSVFSNVFLSLTVFAKLLKESLTNLGFYQLVCAANFCLWDHNFGFAFTLYRTIRKEGRYISLLGNLEKDFVKNGCYIFTWNEIVVETLPCNVDCKLFNASPCQIAKLTLYYFASNLLLEYFLCCL